MITGRPPESRVYDVIIRDATIVRAGRRLVADVAVEDGRVAYVGGQPGGPGREEINAIGRFLIPGLIDSDLCLEGPQGVEPARWATETTAAAVRGVTTVLHRPLRPVDDAGWEQLRTAAGSSFTSVAFWATSDRATAERAQERVALGQAVGISLRVGEGFASLDDLVEVHAMGDSLLGIQAEDPAVVASSRARWKGHPSPVHNDIHPPEAALSAARVILGLAKARPTRRMHVHQVSTSAELGCYDPFRDEIPLTLGVTPTHLYLSTDTVDQQGGLLLVDPPIRPELDRRALWNAVKRGRVDTCASGHRPLRRADKAGGYAASPAGLPAGEVLPSLMFGAVKNARLSLERMVEICCESPARILGLTGKGRIEVGADADLLLFSEGETARLSEGDLLGSAGWSPFAGREVGSPPLAVLVNGRIVARAGRLMDVSAASPLPRPA